MKGKVTTNPKKSDSFARHYAGVSKLTFSREGRARNRKLKRVMQTQASDGESCKEFDMVEMESALRAMRANGAPVRDDIPPTFPQWPGTWHWNEIFFFRFPLS